jgi:hypothetical protein
MLFCSALLPQAAKPNASSEAAMPLKGKRMVELLCDI